MNLTQEIPSSTPAPSHASDGVERVRVGDRATIFRTANSPNWYLQYNLDGKQFRSSLKTRSKKRAIELAQKKDAQLILGQAEPPATKPLSITEASTSYLRSLAGRGRSSKTIDIYRTQLEIFAAFGAQQGVTLLNRVSAELLENFQQQLQERGFVPPGERKSKRGARFKATSNAPGTVRDKLKTVRQLINWARKRGLLRNDPVAGYELPPRSEAAGLLLDSVGTGFDPRPRASGRTRHLRVPPPNRAAC